MLTHPTLEQMQALGLTGMAAAYRQIAEPDDNAISSSKITRNGRFVSMNACFGLDGGDGHRNALALRHTASGVGNLAAKILTVSCTTQATALAVYCPIERAARSLLVANIPQGQET